MQMQDLSMEDVGREKGIDVDQRGASRESRQSSSQRYRQQEYRNELYKYTKSAKKVSALQVGPFDVSLITDFDLIYRRRNLRADSSIQLVDHLHRAAFIEYFARNRTKQANVTLA
jgi:hypothetical protein